MSVAIVALGALLLWWIIPFGAQVGEQAPPSPTPTRLRPTAVSLAQLLPSPTATPTLTPSPTLSPTPTIVVPQHLDAELVAPGPTSTPTGTPEPPTATPEPPTPTPEPTATPAPSASEQPVAAGPTASPRVHTVEQGDMLNTLANRYGVTAAEIAEANGITLTTILSLGQTLIIPAAGEAAAPEVDAPSPTLLAPTILVQPTAGPPVHVVQQGDTLNTLARRYGVTAEEFAQANGITLTTILSLGQHLVIPGGSPTAAPATAAAPTETAAPEATAAVQRTVRPTEAPTPTPQILRHVVTQGDTLGALALRYGVSAEEIAKANDITLTTILKLDQELVIPGQTAEPEIVATATPEATTTPTATPSATPTSVPIRTPATTLPYRAPRPLTPISGAILRGDQSQPVLQWTSVGILADDQWYQVSLWTPESRGEPVETLTKATFWRVPVELYPQGRRESRFEWQVVVIQELDVAPGRVALSPAGATYWFTWR